MSATMAKTTPTATSQAFSVSSTEEDDEVIKKREGERQLRQLHLSLTASLLTHVNAQFAADAVSIGSDSATSIRLLNLA